MNAKSQNLPQPWVDPDDAPELTDEFFGVQYGGACAEQRGYFRVYFCFRDVFDLVGEKGLGAHSKPHGPDDDRMARFITVHCGCF